MGKGKLEVAHPTNRADARRLGVSLYFTGRPCVNGHVSVRYACSAVCLDCAADLRKRPDIAEKCRKRAKAWVVFNPERFKQNQKAWKQRNPDKTAQYRKTWRAKYGQTIENKQKQMERRRRQNQKQRTAHQNARRAQKLSATPRWADMVEIRKFYEACPDGYHVDHIIPLKHPDVCGLHVIYNLQYLTAMDNIRKKNRLVA